MIPLFPAVGQTPPASVRAARDLRQWSVAGLTGPALLGRFLPGLPGGLFRARPAFSGGLGS